MTDICGDVCALHQYAFYGPPVWSPLCSFVQWDPDILTRLWGTLAAFGQPMTSLHKNAARPLGPLDQIDWGYKQVGGGAWRGEGNERALPTREGSVQTGWRGER